MTQGFDLLIKISSEWQVQPRLDIQLLLALCKLSLDNPKKADDGFTSLDLAEVISKMRHGWSDLNSPEQVSSDVRRQWKKLDSTWKAKAEGISQHFQNAGISLVPTLDKAEGGGAGRLSYYRIVWKPLDINAIPNTEIESQTLNSQSIKYVCEDITEANWLARIFKDGYHLTQVRKIIMAIVIAIPLIIAWLLLVFFLFGTLTLWDSIGTPTVIKSFGILVLTCAVVWTLIGKLLSVSTNKIVLAPWWMQSINDDRLLEHRHPPRYKYKSVKAVHYTATCPKCNGKVSAKSGGWSFWGRIVGRCENSPNEHIYSFDHITRLGLPLR